jgi:hypothetical protein
VARTWRVLGTTRYRTWRDGLDEQEQDAINAVIEHLKSEGSALRRPLSGQIKSSRDMNMKELIPPQANIRILYVFDPDQDAMLLLGGDKTGDWPAGMRRTFRSQTRSTASSGQADPRSRNQAPGEGDDDEHRAL